MTEIGAGHEDARTVNTAQAREWWIRQAEFGGRERAEHYWNDWQAPHRQQLVLALGLVSPVASVYEIGCHAGPNLRLIWQYFPHLRLGGLEGVKLYADAAHVKLGVPIDHGLLPDALPDTEWDVILSCYTMAYLDPEDAHVTMLRLNRMAQHAIIIAEPLPVGSCPVGQCRDGDLPEWRHDYEKVFGALGWHTAWKWPLIPPAQNLNAMLVLTRG